MKTIKFLCTVTALAFAAFATAVERPKMEVVPLSPDRAVVSIVNENPAIFEMSIETKSGDIVFYKQTTNLSTVYQQVFDFKNLEKGSYVLNFRVNDTNVSRKFDITGKEIFVGEQNLRFDPYFSFNNNLLKLSYLNFDMENYNLFIYNENGLVFKKKIGNDFTIQSGFNLSKLESGNYKVVLSSRNNEYVYNVVK